jgi:hypothetical protein
MTGDKEAAMAIVKLIASSDQLRMAETLVTLNREFEQILGNLRQLQQFGVFQENPPQIDFLKSSSQTLEELRVWTNFVLSDLLRERAEIDRAFFKQVRIEGEKKRQEQAP